MGSLLLGTIIRAVLPVVNKFYAAVLNVRPLARDSILSVELKRHKGSSIRLKGGCEVRPGDRVLKLHLNNAWIADRWRSRSNPDSASFPRGLIHYFRDSLQLLAQQMAAGKYDGVVAICGWTAFHIHAGRLGFQVMDLPNNLRMKLAELHIAALMQGHQIPWLKKRAPSRKPITVKAVWLSRAELLRIYGSVS